MKKVFILAAVLLLIIGTANAVDVPNTFSTGEPASADDVNENFSTLADAVTELEEGYTGELPVIVDEEAGTIGLNPASADGVVLTWDSGDGHWVAAPIPAQKPAAQPHENRQPYNTVNFIIALQGVYPSRNGSEPYLGEITMFAGNFAPRGWAFCDGQLLAISQNTALFSLLGTMYGGDGRTTFALPDLRGRVPIHPGQGPGLSPYSQGSRGGAEQVAHRYY